VGGCFVDNIAQLAALVQCPLMLERFTRLP
jgi:hypothetical protein